MSLQNTSGIILKVVDFAESDKIITFYCAKEGKFTCIAKGAKRSAKRFVNKLELFTLLDFQYNTRYSLPTLDQAELQNSFPELRKSYPLYATAGLICELLLQWTHENDGDIHLFSALAHTFAELIDPKRSRKPLLLFLIFLYSRLGYQPDFGNCIKCGESADRLGSFYFIPAQSGLCCQKCGGQTSRSAALSLATVKLLGQAQKMPFSKSTRLQFSPPAIQQALRLYKRYGDFLLDRQILSWAYIDLPGVQGH
jgi:DNA repair protein RecO (recombination protein O)